MGISGDTGTGGGDLDEVGGGSSDGGDSGDVGGSGGTGGDSGGGEGGKVRNKTSSVVVEE